MAGEDSRYGFQSTPPYTSPRLVNVWNRDRIEDRLRGGSRPGLRKVFTDSVTAPVHLLANVRSVESDVNIPAEDRFDSSPLGGHWTNATWMGGNDTIRVRDGYAYVDLVGSGRNAALLLADLGINAATQYTVEMDVLMALHALGGFEQQAVPLGYSNIFVRINGTNALTDSIQVRVTATGSIEIFEWDNGTSATLATGQSSRNFNAPAERLKVSVSGSTITVTWMGQTISGTVTAATGERIAWGLQGDGIASPYEYYRLRVDNFKVDYRPDDAGTNRSMVVVAGGSNAGASSTLDIKYEDTAGSLTRPASVTATATDVDNPKSRHLQAAELLGDLFIVGEDSTTMWVLKPATTGKFSIISDDATLAWTPDPSQSGGGYPSDTTSVCAWRTRIVTAGKRTDPHNWYMSKIGVPQNWEASSLSIGGAVYGGTTGIDTGKMGEPITALIPHSDDYLILGCLSSIYVMRGDPTDRGIIDRVSDTIGIVSPQAWARGPGGETVILSQDGIYVMAAGSAPYPQSLSRERLPRELRDVSVGSHRVLMAYDARNRGVFIGLTRMLGTGGDGIYFWLDWETRGFSRLKFNSAHEPTALVYRAADAAHDQRLLLGCRDGFVRAFYDESGADDDIPITQEAWLGPIMLGAGSYRDGILREFVARLGDGSVNITADVYVGDTIEAAYRSTRPKYTCTLKQGLNITHYPNVRGHAAFIKLSTTSAPWALETMTIVREPLGKLRQP